jgi:hypothetical protein
MNQFTIRVAITRINETTTVILNEHWNEYQYDISSVITDFMNSEQARGIKGYKKGGVYYSDNPFEMFLTDDIEDVFYEDMKKALQAAAHFKKLVNNQGIESLSEFETIRNQNKLELNYRGRFIDEDSSGEYDWGYEESVSFNFDTLRDHNHQVIYTCHNMTDIITALFHYYIITGYKFSTCRHCGREFATQTMKTIYCNRISPYKNKYSQKGKKAEANNCYDTVHNYKQLAKQQKNKLSFYLRHSPRHTGDKSRNSEDEQDINLYYEFMDLCTSFETAIKKEPTPKNFKRYFDFLDKTKKNEAWHVKNGKEGHTK